MKFLLSSDDDKERIGVLPIVGMGGLGKTTLARLAYDDKRVNKDQFELRAWVTVSTDFNVSRIIKSLLQQIGGGIQTEEPAVLQREMKEALSGKKFLFVLDDVWDENYDNWDLLKSNFASGDPRSKIIVTTRSRRVCVNVKTGRIHELELVSADDCWNIFSHDAFNGDLNSFPWLEKIGKEIVENCKGLPLAVKSVGGLLRSERDPKKWESILRSSVWSSNNENGVLPSLWLSYRCLPSPLKQCFAYCAIFPQDYEFLKERMVLMWMAEGFLQPGLTKEKSLEEVGDEYFEVLVSRSFFQRHYGSWYVMHDLVHDLATFVSGRATFRRSEVFLVSELRTKLDVALRLISSLLNDAEDKQVMDVNVNKWVDNLNEVLNEADKVMDNINNEALHRMEREIKINLEEIILMLNDLYAKGVALGLKGGVQSKRLGRSLAPLIEDSSDVYGRDSDKEAILKFLFPENVDGGDKISMIPIVGMGGVGKTTLARLVYDDRRVKSHFEHRAWVTVSDDFDVWRIAKLVLEGLSGKECEVNELGKLGEELEKFLGRNKFFLVLDDVWNEDSIQWDLLKSYFEVGADGSKIIVTTRSERVGSMMGSVPSHLLQTMAEEDCWKLFEKHAFHPVEERTKQLEAIGREIVKKSRGLPLALVSVASLLRSVSDPKDWDEILTSDAWKLVREDTVIPALWLSYIYLPSELKRCFAYCSIFPKDYKFEKEKIIFRWMTKGLVQGENMEDVGEEYFNSLVSRSLLQRSFQDESSFLMHDLVHDLATFVSGRATFRRFQDGLLNLNREFATLSHLHTSIDFHLDSAWQMPDLSKQLRTLILARQSRWDVEGGSGDLVCEKITKLVFLRSLDLHNTGIKTVPSSIAELTYLRYLDLSRNVNLKELPNSITSLRYLQTLKLNNCRNLRSLPRDITKLVNLRFLENESCYSLTCMPPGIGQLTNLQTLSEFVLLKSTTSKRSGKLDELRNLNSLNGRLKIKNLRCPDHDRTKDTLLKDKKRLQSLVLIWDIEASTDHEQSLEDLRPHPNLRELCLSSYGGVKFSSWLPSHESLVEFMLLKCTKCRHLPALDCLPSLRVLRVEELAELTHVSEEEGQVFFPSLRELELKNLPKLEQWWKHPDNVKHKAFPSLSKLVIEDCPNLTSMPRFPGLEEQLVMKNTKWDPFKQTIAWSEASSSSSSSSRSSLSKLRTLSIVDMPDCDVAIWKSLPSLRALTLDHIPEIKPILKALKCITGLKELNISRCDSLKKISGWISNIKSLTSLSIRLCPNLKIPSNQISLITSLQRVKIENCPEVCHIEGMIKDCLYTRQDSKSSSCSSGLE